MLARRTSDGFRLQLDKISQYLMLAIVLFVFQGIMKADILHNSWDIITKQEQVPAYILTLKVAFLLSAVVILLLLEAKTNHKVNKMPITAVAKQKQEGYSI